jgi:hypothetical protein
MGNELSKKNKRQVTNDWHLKHSNEVRGISPPYSMIIIGIELDNEKATRVICSNKERSLLRISLLGNFIGFEFLGSPHILYYHHVGYVQDLLETMKQKTETREPHR